MKKKLSFFILCLSLMIIAPILMTGCNFLNMFKKATLTGFDISTTGAKTIFYIGEEFTSDGLQILKHYDNDLDVLAKTSEYTVDSSLYKKNTIGRYKITVKLNNTNFSKDYNVEVQQKVVNKTTWLSLDTSNTKLTYSSGEFDSTGLKVYLNDSNGKRELDSSEYTVLLDPYSPPFEVKVIYNKNKEIMNHYKIYSNNPNYINDIQINKNVYDIKINNKPYVVGTTPTTVELEMMSKPTIQFTFDSNKYNVFLNFGESGMVYQYESGSIFNSFEFKNIEDLKIIITDKTQKGVDLSSYDSSNLETYTIHLTPKTLVENMYLIEEDGSNIKYELPVNYDTFEHNLLFDDILTYTFQNSFHFRTNQNFKQIYVNLAPGYTYNILDDNGNEFPENVKFGRTHLTLNIYKDRKIVETKNIIITITPELKMTNLEDPQFGVDFKQLDEKIVVKRYKDNSIKILNDNITVTNSEGKTLNANNIDTSAELTIINVKFKTNNAKFDFKTDLYIFKNEDVSETLSNYYNPHSAHLMIDGKIDIESKIITELNTIILNKPCDINSISLDYEPINEDIKIVTNVNINNTITFKVIENEKEKTRFTYEIFYNIIKDDNTDIMLGIRDYNASNLQIHFTNKKEDNITLKATTNSLFALDKTNKSQNIEILNSNFKYEIENGSLVAAFDKIGQYNITIKSTSSNNLYEKIYNVTIQVEDKNILNIKAGNQEFNFNKVDKQSNNLLCENDNNSLNAIIDLTDTILVNNNGKIEVTFKTSEDAFMIYNNEQFKNKTISFDTTKNSTFDLQLYYGNKLFKIKLIFEEPIFKATLNFKNSIKKELVCFNSGVKSDFIRAELGEGTNDVATVLNNNAISIDETNNKFIEFTLTLPEGYYIKNLNGENIDLNNPIKLPILGEIPNTVFPGQLSLTVLQIFKTSNIGTPDEENTVINIAIIINDIFSSTM